MMFKALLIILLSTALSIYAQVAPSVPSMPASPSAVVRLPSVKNLTDGYIEVVLKNGKVVVGQMGKPVAVDILIHGKPSKVLVSELPENLKNRVLVEGRPPWVKLSCDGLPPSNELIFINNEWKSFSDITISEVSFKHGSDEEVIEASNLPDSLSAQFVDSAKKLPSAVRYNKISGSFKAYNLAGLNGIIVGEIKEPVFVPISTGKDVYYIPIEAPTNGTFETIVDSVQRGIYSVSTSGGDITHTKELADKLFTLKALEDMVKKNDDDGPESNWTYQRMGGFASWAEAKTAQNGVNSSSGAIQNWFKEYLHAIDLKRSSDVAGWVNSIKKLRIQYPLLWKRE